MAGTAKKPGMLKRLWRWLVTPSRRYLDEEPAARKTKVASKPSKSTPRPKKKKQKASDQQIALTKWGFVDASGNVRLRGGDQKIIGKTEGDKTVALEKFAAVFIENEAAVEKVLSDLKQADDPVKHLSVLKELDSTLRNNPGLGDISSLERKLDSALNEVHAQAETNKNRKLRLIKDADHWSNSSDWLEAERTFNRMKATWKSLPSAAPENDEPLAKRFETANVLFEERREKSLNDFDGNAAAKRQCIAEMEELASGEDWEDAHGTVSELVERWQSYGPAGEEEATLTRKFKQTRNAFVESFAIYNDRLEQEANLAENSKRGLIRNMEELLDRAIPDAQVAQIARDQKDSWVNQWEVLGSAEEEVEEELNRTFQDLEQQVFSSIRNFREKQKAEQQAAIGAKRTLIASMTQLSIAEPLKIHWKDAEKTRKELEETWKGALSAGRRDDKDLNREWNNARQTFFDKRTTFFELREEQRALARERKKILTSGLPLYPLGSTSRDLQLRLETSLASWKAAGSAGRDFDDDLWEAYSEARQAIFDEVKNLRSIEREEFTENLGAAFARKKDLLYKLEDQVRHDEMLQEREEDKQTARDIKQNQRKIEALKIDLLSMQRKLSRLQENKTKTKAKTEASEPPSSSQIEENVEVSPQEETISA